MKILTMPLKFSEFNCGANYHKCKEIRRKNLGARGYRVGYILEVFGIGDRFENIVEISKSSLFTP